ncbi:MAG: hypothetical protein JNJ54_11055 [Myxococcaceae bacterium]|nr:hypothetical protein [Myxococcaceae bacterium]
MNKWLLVALAVGGSCVACTGGALVLAVLAADDEGGSPPGTAACPDSVQGWQQTVTPAGLVLTRDQLVVELPWAFPFTDALRQGDSEENVWRAVLGERYEPRGFTRAGFGELRLAGPAVERSSGRVVFISFTSGAMSGIANPVAVIGDEAIVQANFPTAGSLLALQQLNRFALGCADVAGRWKSGFSTAAERYAAGTGRFVGVEAVAAWRDLTLEPSGSYRRESSALLNGVFSKRVDSGGWSRDDWSLTLEPEGATPIAFDAALVRVQSGFLLRLTNRQFSADTEEFQRVE